jgi:hypothetical protein
MSSTLNLTQSEFSAGQWAKEPPVDAGIRSAERNRDRFPDKRRSIGRRASRALARFLITFGIGVAATVAWQSYGDAAREIVANSTPQLAWLAPQAASAAQATPEIVAPPPVSPAADLEQLKAVSLGLAVVRQSLDQLAARFAAGQEQMTRDITKLQAAEQDILQKISAPPTRPVAAPVHKPVPPAPPQAAPAR